MWLRCNAAGTACNPIAGATGSTYVTTNDDTGTRLRVQVTATHASGSATNVSNATPVLGGPEALAKPQISGDTAIERINESFGIKLAEDGFARFSFLASTPEQEGEIVWKAPTQ